MGIGLPVYKKIIKKIGKKFIEHKLAVKLLSQDENLKNLTNIILKKRNIIFGLIPKKGEEIVWETRTFHIKKGSFKKILYYKISVGFDPSKCCIVPRNRHEQLIWLAHEFAHIVLEHFLKTTKGCGFCQIDCLKEELEADVAINGALKMVGLKVILNKAYWKYRITHIMDQCQEENQEQKCLRVILDGKCPETKSIKLYLEMIALDAQEGFLSK